MSKLVKELVSRDIKSRLDGVEDAVIVSTVGMDANTNCELRAELSKSDISMMVIKNSLARRATEGTSLAPMFEGASGELAVCFGATDFVSLVKEIVKYDKDKEKFDKFTAAGGVMDGEHLDPDGLAAVSKWPSRQEQISMLVGQLCGPGATLSAALLGPGKALASQVKSKSEED